MDTTTTSQPDNPATYRPDDVVSYFDRLGDGEWTRLTQSPVDEVSLHIHTHYLEKHVAKGHRVLEIGAGAGRFTQVLAGLEARIAVADLSPVQLDLNRRYAAEYGFAHAVESWQQVDICDLSRFEPGSFDRVVAYGGPFSYVLDRRDGALRECLRVLKPQGLLLLSVMSLWGSAHRVFDGVFTLPPDTNRAIIRTGDISPETWPERPDNFMHLFRVAELRRWLEQSGLAIVDLSASGCLSTTWNAWLEETRGDADRWNELLRIEVEASADPGCLGMGTHLLAVAQETSNAG